MSRTTEEVRDLIASAGLVAGVEPRAFFEQGNSVELFWFADGETWTLVLRGEWLFLDSIPEAEIIAALAEKMVTNPFLKAVNKALCGT